MARISSQLGPLHGNDGNIAYRTINGVTYFYTIDTEKPRKERSKLQKTNSCIIALMNRLSYQHYSELQLYFPKGKHRSSRHAFMSRNKTYLTEALRPLALRMVEGEIITAEDLDNALSGYATQHPDLILIGSKPGFKPIYLSGDWPAIMTFRRNELVAIPAEYEQVDGTFVQVNPNSGTTGGGNTSQSGGGVAEQVTITVTASPANGGNVQGGGTVAKGSSVTLSATAHSGFSFARWNDGNTSAQRTVIASESITYTAQFNATQPSGGNGDD